MKNHDTCRRFLMTMLTDEVRRKCPDLERLALITVSAAEGKKKDAVFSIPSVKFQWKGKVCCRYKARGKGWGAFLDLAKQSKFKRGSIQSVYEDPLGRKRFEGYATIISYAGNDIYFVIFKEDLDRQVVRRKIIHKIADSRHPHQVITDLKDGAKDSRRCRKNLPDCAYWAWGACMHRNNPKPDCVYLSREARGFRRALGARA